MANKVSGSKERELKHIPLILTSEELTTLIYLCRPDSIKQESAKMQSHCRKLQQKLARLMG